MPGTTRMYLICRGALAASCSDLWQFGHGLRTGTTDGRPTHGAGPEQATFALADANLTIDLVAAEPDVISPVAMCWDADGAMYVAEMRDYPVGPAAGAIRRLVDADGDGRYERGDDFRR